jgi:plastocyanin
VRLRPAIRARSGRKRIAAAVFIAAAIAIGGAQARAETIRIEVKSLAFSPAQVTAHVGDTIEWANADFVAHTATARNKDWDVQLPPNKTGRITLKKAGTVEYFCRFHPNMTATVAVEEAKR